MKPQVQLSKRTLGQERRELHTSSELGAALSTRATAVLLLAGGGVRSQTCHKPPALTTYSLESQPPLKTTTARIQSVHVVPDGVGVCTDMAPIQGDAVGLGEGGPGVLISMR